jgi:hypothetical protein
MAQDEEHLVHAAEEGERADAVEGTASSRGSKGRKRQALSPSPDSGEEDEWEGDGGQDAAREASTSQREDRPEHDAAQVGGRMYHDP